MQQGEAAQNGNPQKDHLIGVEEKECGQQARYYTDSEDKVVKTTIVERNE